MTKSIFASKTIWGGIAMILPTILSLIGFDISAGEVQTGTDMVMNLVEKGLEFFGFIMVIIGRFKATNSVSVLGG